MQPEAYNEITLPDFYLTKIMATATAHSALWRRPIHLIAPVVADPPGDRAALVVKHPHALTAETQPLPAFRGRLHEMVQLGRRYSVGVLWRDCVVAAGSLRDVDGSRLAVDDYGVS